jgi:tRNA(Arg) A34 adenosine deaminase TadA
MEHPQRQFMQLAIDKAREGASKGVYALGSIIVDQNGEVIAAAHNTAHADNDPTAHGEVNAIRLACKKLGSRYLPGCWLYTTLEPCPMCTAAAIWAKMEGVVFGATKEDAQEVAKSLEDRKFTWRQIDMSSKEIIEKGEPRVRLIGEFMRDECGTLFEYAK